MIIVQPLIIYVMMEKKYQLVAWTRNSSDKENARLYVVPSVEIELLEPLITEVSECRKEQQKAGGFISLGLARRFIKVYEQSARLDMLTGHIDDAIRFFLLAADFCIDDDDVNWVYDDTDLGHYSYFCGELRHEFERLCEEAISLAGKYGLEHVLKEEKPKRTLSQYYEHTQEERDLQNHLREMESWR